MTKFGSWKSSWRSRTSRARRGYVVAVGLLASAAVIAAVWAIEPRYRAIVNLTLAGRTLPSDRELDAARFASEYVQSMRERVVASLPKQENAGFAIVETATAAPGADEPASVSIGFEIFVDDAEPRRAGRTVEQIVDAYADAHRKAVAMLQVPADELEAAYLEISGATAELERLGLSLSEFERDNAAALPGLEELHAQAIQQAESERTGLDQTIAMLEARRTELDRALNELQRGANQFSATDSQPLTSEILAAVQARWAVLRGRYGTDSPEAVELGAAIAQAQATVDAQVGTLAAEFDDAKAAYESAQKDYPLDHPDVIGFAHRVSALERVVDETRVVGLSNRDRRYIESLARERAEIDGQIAESKDFLAAVDTSLVEHQLRAARAPQLEKQHIAMQTLVADAQQRYERATTHHAALQAALDAARYETPGELSVASEVRVERLILSWPAVIAGLSCLLSLPAFIFTLGVLERRRRLTVIGADLIARLQGRPPLAEIPELGGK